MEPLGDGVALPSGENGCGDLSTDDEDAGYLPALVNGAVGVVPVKIFENSVSFEGDEHTFAMGAGAVGQDLLYLRADDVPSFLPNLVRGLAEAGGVFCAHNRNGGVVIEHDKTGAPEDEDGHRGGQGCVHDGEQLGGPGFDGTEWSGGPVGGAHELGHHAAGVEGIAIQFSCLFIAQSSPPTNRLELCAS